MRRGLHRRFPATIGLVTALLLVFGLEMALGGSTDMATLVRLGAMRPDRVVEHGEVFRLFTGTWLHFGPIHLLLNLFALAQLASLVEHVWGGARMLFLYLLCGLFAALVSASFGDFGRPVVGASGAVMGLAGLLLGARYVGDPALRLFLEEVLGRRLMWSVLITFGVGILLELFLPLVDNLGHLGGFLAGVALSFAMPESDSSPAPTRIGLLAFTIALLTSATWAGVSGGDALETLDHDLAQQLRRNLDGAEGSLRASLLLPEVLDRFEAAGEEEAGQALFEHHLDAIEEPSYAGAVLGLLLDRPERDREAAMAMERWLSIEPDEPAPLNAAAWFLVTRSQVERRDPARAVELSKKSLRRIEAPHTRTEKAAVWAVRAMPRTRGLFAVFLGPEFDDESLRAACLDTLGEALLQQGSIDEALEVQSESAELARALQLDDLPAIEARLAAIQEAQ